MNPCGEVRGPGSSLGGESMAVLVSKKASSRNKGIATNGGVLALWFGGAAGASARAKAQVGRKWS